MGHEIFALALHMMAPEQTQQCRTHIKGLFTQGRRVGWTLVEDRGESLTDGRGFVDGAAH